MVKTELTKVETQNAFNSNDKYEQYLSETKAIKYVCEKNITYIEWLKIELTNPKYKEIN